jgi:hypothetical protein
VTILFFSSGKRERGEIRQDEADQTSRLSKNNVIKRRFLSPAPLQLFGIAIRIDQVRPDPRLI